MSGKQEWELLASLIAVNKGSFQFPLELSEFAVGEFTNEAKNMSKFRFAFQVSICNDLVDDLAHVLQDPRESVDRHSDSCFHGDLDSDDFVFRSFE
jgi:hypothetical protein